MRHWKIYTKLSYPEKVSAADHALFTVSAKAPEFRTKSYFCNDGGSWRSIAGKHVTN